MKNLLVEGLKKGLVLGVTVTTAYAVIGVLSAPGTLLKTLHKAKKQQKPASQVEEVKA